MTDVRSRVRDQDDRDYEAIALAPTPRDSIRDIYGPLGAARRRAPVHQASQVDLAGLPNWRSSGVYGDRPVFTVLSFDACAAALANAEVFSSRFHAENIGKVWGHTVLGMDDPEHKHYRSLIVQAFTKKSLGRWQEELIEPAVHGIIDRFAGRERVDLHREFHLLFPVYIISGILGIPEADIARFHSWAVETMTLYFDFERGMRASKALGDYLVPVIEERRADPRDDLISALTEAEIDGERLTDDDIVAFVRTLLAAGGETTFRSSASLMLALLTDTAQLGSLRDKRELMVDAIDEGLRFEPPLSSVTRITTRATTLAGVDIPENAIVEVAIGTANRDEQRWEHPDTFDLHRDRQPNLAFAWGPHTCLGLHLARLETAVAVNALLDRFPHLRLDPEAPRPEMMGIGFRNPTALPVLLS
jgi:cytochrome P450